jgi:hypothetical protein
LPPRPQLSCTCSECSAPIDGRTALRAHLYAVHGIHWDKRRAPRGTPRVRKEWTESEIKLLRTRGFTDDVLSNKLGRSVGAIQVKRKRIVAEILRRAAEVVTSKRSVVKRPGAIR